MELTISNLIKIILGVLVFVVVVVAVYIFFKDQVIGFFDNFVPKSANKLFLVLNG